MNKTTYFTLFFILISILLFAQQNKDVAVIINGKPIYKETILSEFRQTQALNDQEDFKSFLDSYIDYQLNVEEAYRQRLDTTKAFQNVFSSYEFQLKNAYLKDTLTEKLLVETIFNRFDRELEVSHIFIPFEGDLLFPKDTLGYYKKALKAREIAQTEEFGSLESELNKVNTFGVIIDFESHTGYLGWIRPFYFSQKLEKIIYDLEQGEITMPIRTEKGYHIFQVIGSRALQGTPVVDQLLFGFPVIPATKQIQDSVYKVARSTYDEISIKNNYDDICAEFSQVFKTGNRGCLLGELNLNSQYPQALIQAAFQLSESGEVSKPILTTYGYHILRLKEKKKIPNEDAIRNIIKESLNSPVALPMLLSMEREELIKKVGLKINYQALDELFELANSYSPNDPTFKAKIKNEDEVLMEVDGGTKKYTIKNFLAYKTSIEWMDEPEEEENPLAMLNLKPMLKYILSTDILENQFNNFVYSVLSRYQRETIESKNPDYAKDIHKIAEGILYTTLQEKEVWNKSKSDEEGLIRTFKANRKKYNFEEKVFKGAIIFTKEENKLLEIKEEYNNDKTQLPSLRKKYSRRNQDVYIESGLWRKGENPYVDSEIFGGEKIVAAKGYPNYSVVGKFISAPEDYLDVKAQVEEDYLQHLIIEWKSLLREKYNVEINNAVINEIR